MLLNIPTGKGSQALLISQVDTTHLLDNPPQISQDTVECTCDSKDSCFPSDKNIYNTAMAYEQSLMIMVGDPVARCAIGDCNWLWRTFPQCCNNLRGLYHHRTIIVGGMWNTMLAISTSDHGQSLKKLQHQQNAATDGLTAAVDACMVRISRQYGTVIVNDLWLGPLELATAQDTQEDLGLDYKVNETSADGEVGKF